MNKLELQRKLDKAIATTAKLVQEKIELKDMVDELSGTLELLSTDIEWTENSPTLKLIKRMIAKAERP